MKKVMFKNHKPVTLFQLTDLDLKRLITACSAELERRSQAEMQETLL